MEPRAPSLEELLGGLAGSTEARGERYDAEAILRSAPAPPVGRSLFAGCLIRFILLVLLLVGAAIFYLFLLFGGALN